MEFGNNELIMLKAMLTNPSKDWTLDSLFEQTGWDDQVHIAGAGNVLSELKYVDINEEVTSLISLGQEGKNSLESGLLESRLWSWITNNDENERTLSNLLSSDFSRSETGPGIGLLKGLGIEIIEGKFSYENMEGISKIIKNRENFISSLADSKVEISKLDKNLVDHFSSRRGLINFEEIKSRTWKLTKKGIEVDISTFKEQNLIGELTPEMLQKESWKGSQFKPFDVSLPAPIPFGGRKHPMQSLIERIRSVFLEMGFSEIEGNFVQSAGWNMDALFIPQSHPARTMQDTFYLSQPESIEIEEKFLDIWSRVHEYGHDTGSKGWGGSFDKNESRKPLLRTHTTVNTIRHIADYPDIPSRVFGIGRVFRQETIDRTHLPEFHQIEGIIHEPDASLPMLITTLKTFYSKMGYPDVRVRPAYFPYTEPSAEVDILWRGEWLELGGSGIFRPEVTEPLGTEWPVCAWGMGLERLAMLILDLDDIRQLYQPDLEKLREMPLL